MPPALWGKPADQTLRYCVAAVERADRLRRQHPDHFVLVLGSELTLSMHGIVPGRDFAARIRDARIKDRYVEMLQPLLALGKPVVDTEFGVRTYRGAASGGGELGVGVAVAASREGGDDGRLPGS